MTAVPRVAWRHGVASPGSRRVAEEVPVSIGYNGAAYAVLLATPDDLVDFAVGFSLTEGIIDDASEIEEVTTARNQDGILLRVWLTEPRRARLLDRQRRMAGPAGCGLCGIESLAAAVRAPISVHATARFVPDDVEDAVAALREHQPLGAATRAVHAAAVWHPMRGMVMAREDIGRHNALDKLVGGLARCGQGVEDGILVLSSRVSVELVQKASRLGAGVLAAISAPTSLALETAEAAGITLIGVARDDGFEVFTRPDRIRFPALYPTTRRQPMPSGLTTETSLTA